MQNKEYIEYTYKHRKVVMLLAEKYFKDNEELLEQIKYHDLDKLYMYLFCDKSKTSKFHREQTRHHVNDLEKNHFDYIEMVLDWESARYTKPDKPLNAYDTLYAYYPDMIDIILPILKEMGIDKSNTPMEEDVLEYTRILSNINSDDIEKELINYIKILVQDK